MKETELKEMENLFLSINIFNIFDYTITFIGITSGVLIEANPFMQDMILTYDGMIFKLIGIFICSLILIILHFLAFKKKFNSKFNNFIKNLSYYSIVLIFYVYMYICLWNIFLYFSLL